MAKMNLQYYHNDDRYTDGDIENDILALAQQGVNVHDLPAAEVSFPILYHLTHVRENILNWYPFTKTASVLEVGAGCGAITGLLCARLGHVTAVDLSKRRADINLARHQNCENLDIYVGNLNDMEFAEPFDYIVLNGVFEYAISFTEGETPYQDFLTGMAKFLKPNGQIIIAIENRLGLKYFAGAVEDHTSLYFLGLNEYENYNLVRTFSKTEMEDLLRSVGFQYINFYYPYPDYKFPTEIFTAETFSVNGYGKNYPNFDAKTCRLFDENRVARSLAKEEVMSVFSNSFLVVASRADLVAAEEILYSKLNSDRAEQFRIMTTIKKQGGVTKVVKSALSPGARRHLKMIYNHTVERAYEQHSYLQGTWTEDGIVYPYLESGNLNDEIVGLMEARNIDGILAVIHEIYDGYLKGGIPSVDYHTAEFEEVFGSERLNQELICISKGNIDLICDNLFRHDQQLVAIDCEWIFDFQVPTQFIIWRTINEIYAKYGKMKHLMPIDDFFQEFDIDQRMTYVFWSWSIHFAKEYVGSQSLEAYVQNVHKIDLTAVVAAEQAITMMAASLYYDDGSGYREEHKLTQQIQLLDGRFRLEFDLSQIGTVRRLRFDPLEGEFCACQLKCGQYQFRPLNASLTDGEKAVFLTVDPMYEAVPEQPGQVIVTIEGQLEKLDNQRIEDYIARLLLEQCEKDQRQQVYATGDSGSGAASKTTGIKRFFGR